tara:strand:- start:154 stop:594 length:441 start_codon:yes stop_codon:yes gene_type:complete
MVTMAQALIKKPVQTMNNDGDGYTLPSQTPSGQGGLRGWERASNFNNFMNNTIPGYGIQAIMPGGFGLGLAARANNAYANNAYTNAMNSRESGGQTPQVVADRARQAAIAQQNYGGGMFSDGLGGSGGYSGGQTDVGNDTGSRGFY